MWQLVCLIGVFGLSTISALQVPCQTCSDEKSDATCNFVTIEPCTVQPCKAKQGTTVKFSVSFTANNVSDSLTAQLQGKVLGLWVPFPLPSSNVCASGVQCPLASGQTYVYHNELVLPMVVPSLSLLPSINVDVKGTIKDQNKNTVLCVVIPAVIQV